MPYFASTPSASGSRPPWPPIGQSARFHAVSHWRRMAVSWSRPGRTRLRRVSGAGDFRDDTAQDGKGVLQETVCWPINVVVALSPIRWFLHIVLLAFSLLAGCGLPPAERLDLKANELGFPREIRQGTRFQHVAYRNDGVLSSKVLHVYLDGDGSPWLRERWVASDPTPRQPLVLQLMALDPGPSVYLGRPCYHGMARVPPCKPEYWTHGRYSEPVVASMAAALEDIAGEREYEHVVLFGYSGGGALAMFLAERVQGVSAVVTVAANLDPDAWARYHKYTPLWTSLNPARRPPLDSGIRQLHLGGKRDRNIPPQILQGALAGQRGADLWLFSDFDHRCCWEEVWPEVLKHLQYGARAEVW